MNSQSLIYQLRKRIVCTFRRILPDRPKCALLDFPDHANVGDSAIWLGEKKLLEEIGARIVYECDLASYSRAALAERIGDGIILLHGGGNFGDVWPKRQLFRERVVETFQRNRIIFLPQTIFFRDTANLRRARAVLNKHPDLVVLARDRRSLEIACTDFKGTAILCPDMAFMLGELSQHGSRQKDIIWLARTDVEARAPQTTALNDPNIAVLDWLSEPATILSTVYRRSVQALARHPRALKSLASPLRLLLDQLATQRVLRGARMLSSGRVVITDRLHAHIMSLLLGIPHVVLDNNYGKVKEFYSLWTGDCETAVWAESVDEALHRARRLVASAV
jgi:exopolysaccharide biosynthesis predicted pyruvyltransferase EpsI